jgi:hypothetical protein
MAKAKAKAKSIDLSKFSFKEAFHLATDIMNVVTDLQTAKTLVIMWNILCVTQNKLDDLVYIDDNNTILPIPKGRVDVEIKKLSSVIEPIEDKEEGNEGQKSSTDETAQNSEENTDENNIPVEDGKEKEQQKTTE